MICVNVFYINRNKISVGSDKTWTISHRHDVTKVGDFYKFFVFCRINLKFYFWLYKKRWHTPWQFQLEIRSNKKVIAKSLWQANMKLTLGYGPWTFGCFDQCCLRLPFLISTCQKRSFSWQKITCVDCDNSVRIFVHGCYIAFRSMLNLEGRH